MFFLFFQRQISELLRPIAVKLCHTIGIWFYFIMQVQKLGGLSPKKIWGPKTCKISVDFIPPHTLIANMGISQEQLKTSKIGKLTDREQFLPRSTKKVRWTLVHKWQRSKCEYESTKMHLFGRLHFGPRGCFDLKFLHALEIDQALLADTPTGTGVPKKNLIVKI